MTTILRATALLLALGLQLPAQTLTITLAAPGVNKSKTISGVPAAAGLDTLTQFLATQVDCAGQPQVCTPRYENAADLVKNHLIRLLEEIAPKFPSAATKADADEIDAKIAALQAKRKQLFDAARGEK